MYMSIIGYNWIHLFLAFIYHTYVVPRESNLWRGANDGNYLGDLQSLWLLNRPPLFHWPNYVSLLCFAERRGGKYIETKPTSWRRTLTPWQRPQMGDPDVPWQNANSAGK